MNAKTSRLSLLLVLAAGFSMAFWAQAAPDESWRVEMTAYSPNEDPTTVQSISGFTNTKILQPNIGEKCSFGSVVAQSGDVALIKNCRNFVFWFRRSAGLWQYEKNAYGDGGIAVDGNLVAIGLPTSEPNALTDEGDIAVYHWNGSSWASESLTLPAEHRQEGARLGFSVALEGDILVASAPYWDLLNDGSGNRYDSVGRLYVWKRDPSGLWTFQAALENPRQPISSRRNNFFGRTVRLSQGSVLGAHEDYYLTGRIDFYDLTGNNWVVSNQPINYAYHNHGAQFFYDGTQFGLAYCDGVVALGRTATAYASGPSLTQLFTRSGGSGTAFNTATTLQPSDNNEPKNFGYSVVLSGDRVIIGAPFDSRGSNTYVGAVYVYQRVGNAWTPELKVMADPVANDDYFGTSVASSGNILLAGAVGFSIPPYYGNAGAVYTYEMPIRWPLTVSKLGSGTVVSQGNRIKQPLVIPAVAAYKHHRRRPTVGGF